MGGEIVNLGKSAIIDTINTEFMNNNEPIFIKIAEDFKRLIDLGVYRPGDHLPSVREVALSYSVNPNTAARSYSELIKGHYVVSLEKKGYYVAKEEIEHSQERIYEALKPLIDGGYTKDEILEAIEKWKS